MALTGTLTEFPLPEVLLLIGGRTGRLRLFGAQEFLPMELDVSQGRAHGLHIGKYYTSSASQITAELSHAVETGQGFFAFAPRPIVSLEHPLSINELVLQLALRVDEKIARHQAVLAPQLFYVLEPMPPSADLRPDLHRFYIQSRHLLANGVRAEDLAEYLGVNSALVGRQLYDLHQFGFVKLVETDDLETLREMIATDEISEMRPDYFLDAKDGGRDDGQTDFLRLPSAG